MGIGGYGCLHLVSQDLKEDNTLRDTAQFIPALAIEQQAQRGRYSVVFTESTIGMTTRSSSSSVMSFTLRSLKRAQCSTNSTCLPG